MPWASIPRNPTHGWCEQIRVTQEICIPDIGDIDEVEVIEVCVAPGDMVTADDALLVIESDKASMEVPAGTDGRIEAVLVSVGDTVGQGHPIVRLEAEAEPAAAEAAHPEAADAPRTEALWAPAAEPARGSRMLEVRVPDIGDAADVTVIEVAVVTDQEVTADDLLVVVDSDKASMEIPAGHAGRVLEVHVSEGVPVVEGTLLATIAAEGQAPVQPEPEPAAPREPAVRAEPGAPVEAAAHERPGRVPDAATRSVGSSIYAGPAVRRLARELGVDLSGVSGSGSRGRIVKDDVKSFVKNAMTQSPASVAVVPVEIDFSRFGEVETVVLSRVRAAGAVNLQRSWSSIPHVTQHDEADVTEMETFRASLKPEGERRGVKITPLAFIIKACCYALKEFPTFNASLDGAAKNFILKRYYHIGFAVDTPEGLLVPVIKDADQKGVWELSEEIARLARDAREQKLALNDMQGGSFSVSSLGAIGGTGFTPIINAPEVAILGVARLAMRPVWDGEQFVPRNMLPLSFSYDHRAINGAEAGRFVSYLSELLGDIRRLSL
tara:strand:- start:7112 stop:8764 length:1653 start_codon:yes stop_codon:yes gene_type:complete